MLKLAVVLVALLAIAFADDASLNNQNIVNSRVIKKIIIFKCLIFFIVYIYQAEDIAKWATARLQPYTKLNGELKFVKVSNVKSELVQDKLKFDLSVDVAVVSDAKAAVVKSCQITVLDSPWTNSRILDDKISCVDNTAFQIKLFYKKIYKKMKKEQIIRLNS